MAGWTFDEQFKTVHVGRWNVQPELLGYASSGVFGSVDADGDRVLVGIPNADGGEVWVLQRYESGMWEWGGEIEFAGAVPPYWGAAVSIDGSTAVVGSVQPNTATIFEEVGGVWTQQITLDSTVLGSGSDMRVSMCDGVALVSASNAGTVGVWAVTQDASGGWTSAPIHTGVQLTPIFGVHVSETQAFIGRPAHNDVGMLEVYSINSDNSLSLYQYIDGTTTLEGFGADVDVDGLNAVVGAYKMLPSAPFSVINGNAYILTREANTAWSIDSSFQYQVASVDELVFLGPMLTTGKSVAIDGTIAATGFNFGGTGLLRASDGSGVWHDAGRFGPAPTAQQTVMIDCAMSEGRLFAYSLQLSADGMQVVAVNLDVYEQGWPAEPGIFAPCCLNYDCTMELVNVCEDAGGTWLGEEAACADCPGPPEERSCCVLSGCISLTQADCAALSGVWLNAGEPCVSCPPVCQEDLNGDGAVSVDDLLMLMSMWGPCP